MKKYAVEKGVDADDVFMDHAGFSTYETMYRAGCLPGEEGSHRHAEISLLPCGLCRTGTGAGCIRRCVRSEAIQQCSL